MQLPIDTTRLNLIAIGDPQPQLVYGTSTPKTTQDGRQLFKVPVLLVGTGDRVNPTASITVAGPLPQITNGSHLKATGLVAFQWSMRGADGRERSGLSLRADGLDPVTSPKA